MPVKTPVKRANTKKSVTARKPTAKNTTVSRGSLLPRLGFNKRTALVLVALFAVVGTVFLFRSKAANTGSFIKFFSSENESFADSGTPMTVETAVEQAKNLDLINAGQGTYRGKVADMKAANPSLKLFVYFNGTAANHADGPTSGVHQDAWFLRQKDNHYIHHRNWALWKMNPAQSGWVNNRINGAKSAITFSGYDGVWLDELGTAPLTCPTCFFAARADGTEVAGASSTPINPSTGLAWTKSDLIKANGNLARQVQTGTAKPVGGNGLGNGPEYFNASAPTSLLYDTGNTNIMAEIWMRRVSEPITNFPTETQWKQNVDMLVDTGKRGKSMQAYAKAWESGTQAEKDHWHKFALASFALGTDGNSYFSFRYDKKRIMGHEWWNKIRTIGTPSADYAKSSNTLVYERNFTGGKVLVNPTGTDTTVSLDGTYTTLTGTSVTSVTLNAGNRAEILFKVDTQPAGTADAEKPTAPGNLRTTSVGTNKVDLAWDASTDNVGVSGYNVLRDGQKIATNVPGTSYSDTTVQPGTTYQYIVKAMDAAWNVSDPSNLVDVTTLAGDTTAPLVTISSPLNGSTINGRWISIDTNATDAVGVTKMELFIDGKLIHTAYGNSVSYNWDTKKVTSGYHTVLVQAYDAAQNTGSHSITVKK